MKETEISFRTEGGYSIGVYRTKMRIGVIYFGTDKKWCFSHFEKTDNIHTTVPTLEHSEMHDIIGMMNTLARTDNYGHPDTRTFPKPKLSDQSGRWESENL